MPIRRYPDTLLYFEEEFRASLEGAMTCETFLLELQTIAQCVEAAVLFLSAPVVIWQLKRLREESVAQKAQALREARETLDSPIFLELVGILEREADSGAYEERALEALPLVLAQVDYVALLVRKKYLDKDLLFAYKGIDIAKLADHLDALGRTAEKLEEPGADDYRHLLASVEVSYPHARALIDDARAVTKRKARQK
jgi:hypothetical protein